MPPAGHCESVRLGRNPLELQKPLQSLTLDQ